MRILILNWRDIRNPSGGGAEILTHEVAKRWVTLGNSVTQFSAEYKGSKDEEILDGVKIIRKGRWWTVHIYAFFYYLKHKKSIDVVIDEVHWFPYFSALYAKNKTISLTCEVAGKLLFSIFPRPIAFCFLLLEKVYLYLYRKVPTMVISPSTYKDLLASGHEKENVAILPMGITTPKKKIKIVKETVPTIISIGRLNIQKGTLDVVNAFALIHKAIPKSRLWLVGSGDEKFVGELNKRIDELHLKKAISLYGFVDEEKKFALLARSHILTSASVQEGWGLTVPEAGIMKTPSVVYNIEGFRDIIINKKNGILVDKNIHDLAQKIVEILNDKKKYEDLQKNAYESSLTYTWDNTASTSLRFIKKYVSTLDTESNRRKRVR